MRTASILFFAGATALSLGLATGCRSTGATSDKRDATVIAGSSQGMAANPVSADPKGSILRIGVDPGGVGAGTPLTPHGQNELAAFAGGCFWGTENVFRQVPGVTATAVGYTGGRTKAPSYEAVCSHVTGHAEAVLVEFDPAKVSYDELLRLFFLNHNSTTLNRQGPDVGDQYRSEVFTFSDAQANAARARILEEEKRLGKSVVTKVESLGSFWKAEDYHQQYDEKTGTHSCPIGIAAPKGA